MTQAQKKKLHDHACDTVRMAARYADALKSDGPSMESAVTLESLAIKASSACTAYKSAMAGVEPPKTGA